MDLCVIMNLALRGDGYGWLGRGIS
jgi:hypothetical protein